MKPANAVMLLNPVISEIKGQQARLAALHQNQSKKKPEEITQEEKDDFANTEKALNEQREKKNQIISEYAKDKQNCASANRLGSASERHAERIILDAFIKRSVSLIK